MLDARSRYCCQDAACAIQRGEWHSLGVVFLVSLQSDTPVNSSDVVRDGLPQSGRGQWDVGVSRASSRGRCFTGLVLPSRASLDDAAW